MNKTNLSKQQTNQTIAELASQFNDVVIPKITGVPVQFQRRGSQYGMTLGLL